jgi:hypothetical protein
MKMIVWILFIVCVVAIGKLQGAGHPSLAIFAVINAVANFWSLGVLRNFRGNPEMAPDFFTTMNWISALIGIILLIYAFIA